MSLVLGSLGLQKLTLGDERPPRAGRGAIAPNPTQTGRASGACIHQLFEEQTARTPDATAVTFHGQQLTYQELNERADRLAAHLRKSGAVPDGIVALCAERSLEMIVGLLAILKSGAAYLPLDPSFPSERLAFMLADSQAPILVTEEHLAARFSGAAARDVTFRSVSSGPALEALPPVPVEGHNLAYVIYTSGSTGKPKGVMVEHRHVTNFFAGMDQVIGPQPGVWLAVTSVSFDISALELFWTLARGFTVVLQAESERLAPRGNYSIASQIRNHHVTHLQCTPSMARLMISNQEAWQSLGGLQKLMLGGELLPSGLVTQLRQTVAGDIFNLYGPTETTVWSAAHRIARDEPLIPIGQPIVNTQIYLLDAHLNPVLPGTPGEIFIGGDGVARGYLNRPELTAERFLPDPFRPDSSHRIYRTGDLARCRPDGDLEFLGRIDNQVKILGFRIEPEEIEAVLGRHPDVQAVAVVPREDVPGEKKLVAWLVTGARPVTAVQLRAYAQQWLPEHMVPSAFVITDALPQTPNQKIDRNALAALPVPAAAAPSTANLEETVARIFKEAGIEAMSPHDNFFDVGANSMTMAQVALELQKTLHREILLTDLFKYPTLSALTAHLKQVPGDDSPSWGGTDRGRSRKAALLQRPARPSPLR